MPLKEKLNGNSKWLLHGLVWMILVILGFFGRWAFVEIVTAKEVYATKIEVKELKADVCDDLREIKRDMSKVERNIEYIRRQLEHPYEGGE